jgi:hypothetical protein
MKRKTRETTKAYWMENAGQHPSKGNVQVRVDARSLILGLIRKPFYTTTTQIFIKPVIKTKSDLLQSMILSH